MSVPEFIPRPEQVDYRNIRWCPVINCAVVNGSELLLVRRNSEMKLYPNLWNGISGFLDDGKGLEEKVYEEMSEELGLESHDIESIRFSGVFDQDDAALGKTWIVHAMLVRIKHRDIRIDWEAQEYRWLPFSEAKNMELVPGFDRVLEMAESL